MNINELLERIKELQENGFGTYEVRINDLHTDESIYCESVILDPAIKNEVFIMQYKEEAEED